ncbi:hypothetical protein GCM10009720_09620 [Yaniella flava]|uniref:Uncharacterized protein n=1 Tax=Yaniella flava TaxID=287930 RepID=A0ABN2U904_9MICC
MFNKKQEDFVDRQPIHEIVVDGSEWETVDAWFQYCVDKMEKEWAHNVRRWNDDWK